MARGQWAPQMAEEQFPLLQATSLGAKQRSVWGRGGMVAMEGEGRQQRGTREFVGGGGGGDALMDELLVDWNADRFDRLEQWIKEWSTEEMLQMLLSLKTRVSRNTRNRGLKTILRGTRVPPKCFALCPSTTA